MSSVAGPPPEDVITQTEQPPWGPAANSRPREIAVFIVTLVMGVMAVAATLVISPLLPALQAQYHLTVGQSTWLFNALLLASAVSVGIMPRMADAWGDRRMTWIGLLALAAGTSLLAIGGSYIVLVAGSALVGLGSNTGLLALGIVRRQAPSFGIGVAVMVIALCTGVGGVIGYIFGGLLMAVTSLAGMFWILTAVSGTCLVAILVAVRPEPGSGERIPVVSAVIFAVWAVLILLGLAQLPTWGLPTLWLIAPGVALLAMWVRMELRSDQPLFDLTLLRIPVVARATTAAFLLAVGLIAALTVWPYYLAMAPANGYGFGLDPLQTGSVLSALGATSAVAAYFSSRFVDRGHGVALGFVAALFGFASMSVLLAVHTELWQFCIAAVLMGACQGLGVAAVYGIPQMQVSAKDAGMAVGIVATAFCVGYAVGTSLFIAVLSSASVPGLPGAPREDLYGASYAIAAFVFLATAAVLLPMKGARRRLAR